MFMMLPLLGYRTGVEEDVHVSSLIIAEVHVLERVGDLHSSTITR
jgi:hypothetical protein